MTKDIYKRKIPLFEEVEKLLAGQDPHKALLLLDEYLKQLSDTEKWSQARAHFWKQLCYKQLLDIDNGLEEGNLSRDMFLKEGDRIHAAKAVNDSASIYEHMGKFDKGLEKINESIGLLLNEEMFETFAIAFSKKGKLLAQIGDYIEAEKNFLTSEILVFETTNVMHQLSVIVNVMEFYVKMRDYDKAEVYSKKAEKLLYKLKKKDGYINEIRYSQIELSRSLIAQGRGKYKEAMVRMRNFLKFGVRPKKKKE